MARPPIQAARQAATARLISTYQKQYDDLVDDELASRGWHQEEVTRQKWVNSKVADDG